MPFTHRFQSRLFQTLQSKFYQLQDRVQLHWRQFKIATLWGAQLSLSPIYATFRTVRWSRRVLAQQVAKGARALGLTLGLASAVEMDRPIQNVLAALDVQRIPDPTGLAQKTQTLAPSAQEQQWQISLQPVASHKLSFFEKCSKLWQKWRGAAQQTSAIAPLSSDLARSPAISIQGVASCLSHRRLVLIAAENQVLDILTPEQQQLLHQRIIFEIAVLFRMRRRLGASLPSLSSQSRPLALLKTTWMQLQASAYARGLPVSLAPVGLPGSKISVLPSLRGRIAPRLHTLRGVILAWISAIALAPFALALPARAAMSPALPQPLPAPLTVAWIADPVRTRKQWLKSADLFGQPKPTQGKIRLVPEKTPAALPSESFQTAIADWAYQFSQTIPSSGSPPIDINAVFMGYRLHPLERLLLVLDQMMAWLETQILWLWRQGAAILHRIFL
jgi:hypothetical protein